MNKLLLPLLLAATFLPALVRSGRPAALRFAVPPDASAVASADEAPYFRTAFIADPSPTPSVHAATISELPDGRLLAAWFGGAREGAKDVMIWSSVYDPHADAWSEASILTGPKAAQRNLRRHVRKVGNPILHTDEEGTVWLFFVTVSFGGWSVSHLSYTSSSDGGETWARTRRLVTSPFLNISTLGKAGGFSWDDGSTGLAVYHECLGKFGELLRLGPEMRVLDKVRMTSGRYAIQPVVVPLDETRALALLRNTGHPSGAVLSQRSDDAGLRWSPVAPTELPNPDAAVAALRVADDLILLVYNDQSAGRGNLSLAVSRDEGESWTAVHAFEDGRPNAEYSYPWLSMDSRGAIHLAYTWHRTHIKHATFNEAWVRSLLP